VAAAGDVTAVIAKQQAAERRVIAEAARREAAAKAAAAARRAAGEDSDTDEEVAPPPAPSPPAAPPAKGAGGVSSVSSTPDISLSREVMALGTRAALDAEGGAARLAAALVAPYIATTPSAAAAAAERERVDPLHATRALQAASATALTRIAAALAESEGAAASPAVSRWRQRLYFERARARHACGEYTGAITDITYVLAHNPRDAGAYFVRGFAWKALRKFHLAAGDMETARELAKRTDAEDTFVLNYRGLHTVDTVLLTSFGDPSLRAASRHAGADASLQGAAPPPPVIDLDSELRGLVTQSMADAAAAVAAAAAAAAAADVDTPRRHPA